MKLLIRSLIFIVLALALAWAIVPPIASRKRAERLQANYEEMVRVTDWLNSVVESGGKLPAYAFPQQGLQAGGKSYTLPHGWNFYSVEGKGYGLYAYFWGRYQLRYISYDEGSYSKGWWIDDDASGIWEKPTLEGNRILWPAHTNTLDK